jgi:hypothetical protein
MMLEGADSGDVCYIGHDGSGETEEGCKGIRLDIDEERTHRVDLQIPRFSRRTKIDNDLLVLQAQLLQYDVHPMCVRTLMICIKSDARLVSIDISHIEDVEKMMRHASQMSKLGCRQ